MLQSLISSPVYYYRQFSQDIPTTGHSTLKRGRQILIAALPLLSFVPEARTPLSLGCGGLRSISHLQNIVFAVQSRDLTKASISTAQLTLSLCAVALTITALINPYFNPSIGILLSSADDILGNIVEVTRAIKSKNEKEIVEILSAQISSLLYLSYISFGQIEILASCMLLQIVLNLHKAIDEYRQGHYVEAACHLVTAGFTLHQLIPQARVIEWKWRTNPNLEGVLCRDSRGFVYLKVDDEIIFQLNKIFGDSALPPYFGKGRYGAHVTVIRVGEVGKDIPISEIGKTIKFSIASFDSVKPIGFKGVDRVSFLAIHSKEITQIRSKYGLTPKAQGSHDLHITFGVRNIKENSQALAFWFQRNFFSQLEN